MANGTSDPNISLSANVLDPKRRSRIKGRYKLARDIRESDNVLKSSAEQAQAQNEAAADSSFWGRLVGGGLGVAAGLALAPFTAGTSLAVSGLTAATIGAGIGSYAGSKTGENLAGGIDTTVESGGFGIDKVADINKALDEYEQGVEEDRLMNAASDAFSIYMAGGGGLKPGSIGTGKGLFNVTAAGKEAAHTSLLASGDTLFKGQIKQLIGGVASNYAKKKGLGTAYEEYLNRDKS